MKNLGLSLRNMRKFACGLSLIAACLLFSGCAVKQDIAWQEYKVYCGMSSRNGEVSEDAWQHFCDRHVSAAFPDGYTVIDAAGYWRSGSNVSEKERSKIILIVAPTDVREKVHSVARQYQEQFHQEAVLVSCSDAQADFVRAKE